ncbi:MAG: hypothetical protein J1E43_11895 [Christensenellaceae bacterium]|nr:hypothetical protein [Christensenellaceae bacterium]
MRSSKRVCAMLIQEDEGLLLGSMDGRIMKKLPPLIRLTLVQAGEKQALADKARIPAAPLR